jgi:signal transduction histidine kinase
MGAFMDVIMLGSGSEQGDSDVGEAGDEATFGPEHVELFTSLEQQIEVAEIAECDACLVRGRALRRIHDDQLWRLHPGVKTFEIYCKERWELTRQHAYRLMSAARVMELFVTHGLQPQELPSCERHIAHNARSELSHMNRIATANALSASIAHEVKQPLAAIAANGSAGLRWLAKATPNLGEARAAFERIVNAAHRAGK